MRAVDASDVNVLGPDVRTCFWAGADNVSNERCKDSVRPAADVLEGDVCDIETCLGILVNLNLAISEAMVGTHGMLKALFLIVLTVALSDGDTIVDIVQPHAVIRHISDRARAATSLQVGRLLAKVIRPDFDAGTFRRVVHRYVADEDVLHDVNAFGVLTERSDRDAVRAVARQILHKDVRGVRLEGDAIWND